VRVEVMNSRMVALSSVTTFCVADDCARIAATSWSTRFSRSSKNAWSWMLWFAPLGIERLLAVSAT